MGVCYTVVCRPCRKALNIDKPGHVFKDHVPEPVGKELRAFTLGAMMRGVIDPEWPEQWTPVLIRWMNEHAECGPLNIVNDSAWVDDDLLEEMRPDDPANDWPEPYIGDLCP